VELPSFLGSWQDQAMDSDPRQARLSDAALSVARGGLRILGGMVQMAAGVTRLFAVAALKAADAAAEAVEAAEEDEEPKPKPKPR
jgi:hypothetical protein